ncbi:radical SAM domain protein [Desulfosarcina variabilis str. Montpellier]|uniref:B12-binding domain-containing radical SAM protein n=1 Tax=Desulfosarcina variabilis TaxID=2300 RepID=UPI003AFA82B1
MKILLFSMPDVAPVIMHESAFHMPSLGIASIGGNIDEGHDVYVVDLIRQRRGIKKHLVRRLTAIQPDLVGLSTMTWQYPTCVRIIRLIKTVLPKARIAIGGYHATLMAEEIAESQEARDIDFMVRGEGEESFRRLVNALCGEDRLADIPSLSYKDGGRFVHNPKGELLDLSRLKLPIRDERRLTWGYHIMNQHIEVMETSRGCTRNCNFCSIRHMYGRAFRPFPIARILADIDDIYYNCKARWIFVSDDNLVLDTDRVIRMCDAIIAKGYRNLNLVVQADCVTISRNEPMVAKMAEAGFRSMFLGIESASKKNLVAAKKGDIINASRKAVEICHKYGIMIVGGMIFGFPNDGEEEIIENYRFLKSIGADTAYCQILTPYPKTGIRQELLDQGLVTNPDDYSRYNGMWANVRTHKLSSDELQYLFWYHNENVMGWWNPSERIRSQGRLWTSIWMYVFKPLLKKILARQQKRLGWRGRFEEAIKDRAAVNRFPDLDEI